LEFTILGTQSADTDFIWGETTGFITMAALRDKCESFAVNSCIYEAWLLDSLKNAYRFSKSPCPNDAIRFITYFKQYHEIENEDALALDAADAIREAMEWLR
jgi:hypothetical protein